MAGTWGENGQGRDTTKSNKLQIGFKKIHQKDFKKAVAISPSTAICPWNLFCRDHSRVFI